MESEQRNNGEIRTPLLGQRLVWTVVLLVVAIVGLHYGASAWDEWVRRGLGW